MAYKTVLFDLDGTLIDTLEDLSCSVNWALAQAGLQTRTQDEVRAFTGNGIRRLIEQALPQGCDEKTADAVFNSFKLHYAEHDLDHTRPYPGIEQMVARLRDRGLKLAVVSNKADFAVQRIVGELMGGAFDAVLGERQGLERKPSPQMCEALLEMLGQTKEGVVYVGDSEIDIKTASNFGVDCICCSWGFRDASVLRAKGGRVVVDSVSELESKILG